MPSNGHPYRNRRPKLARVVHHASLKNDAYWKPIVAAVNGDRIGDGLELLLSTSARGAVWPAEVKWAIYPFRGQVPHRHGRESRRPARTVTALGRSCAGAVEAGCSAAGTVAKR